MRMKGIVVGLIVAVLMVMPSMLPKAHEGSVMAGIQDVVTPVTHAQQAPWGYCPDMISLGHSYGYELLSWSDAGWWYSYHVYRLHFFDLNTESPFDAFCYTS